jgi:hypothetical protein
MQVYTVHAKLTLLVLLMLCRSYFESWHASYNSCKMCEVKSDTACTVNFVLHVLSIMARLKYY